MPKRRRTPVFLQMEAVECGAAALGTILAYNRKFVPLEELRTECGVTRDGVKASNIVRAAEAYGLKGRGSRVELSAIDTVATPAIIYWEFNHFVVYEGRGSRGYYINDPGMGHRLVSPAEFDRKFTGVVLEMARTETFKPSGRPFSFAKTCWRLVQGSMRAIGWLFAIGLLLVVPGLALPAATQVVVDDVLVQGMSRWLVPLALLVCAIGITRFSLELTKRILLARLQEKIGLRAAADFIWKLLNLPMRFFTQRSAGELGSRLLVYDVATSFFAKEAPDAILDMLVMGFYIALMCAYSPSLACVALAAAALSVALFQAFASRVETEAAILQQERGRAAGFLVQALSMIETVKLRADERDVLQKTMDLKARVVVAERNSLVVRATSTYLSELLRLGGAAAVLAFGSHQVMQHRLTLGDLVAFQMLMAAFLVPVGNMLRFLTSLQEMKVLAKRVEDVAQYPMPAELPPTRSNEAGASASLEFVDVSFGYNPREAPTIDKLSFRLEPGRSIAFVGGTGSGKSTVAKLVCGLYDAWSGEIRVNGVAVQNFDPRLMGGALALVDQNIALFRGTVLDNITMWDGALSKEDVEQAARDAMIHSIIDKKNDGYHTVVDEEGRNFSGGERQRLEIARALVRKPSLLVLDEATSALDTLAEAKIVENIRARGCGCLVIAHRLSTIRECDEIIVLEKGRVVDRGTHAELLERCDHYKGLVASE